MLSSFRTEFSPAVGKKKKKKYLTKFFICQKSNTTLNLKKTWKYVADLFLA